METAIFLLCSVAGVVVIAGMVSIMIGALSDDQ